MDRRLGNNGFTLLEMMVVVAIIGIAATIAIPSYLKMRPHIYLKSAARDVASTLQIARMTAISQNSSATVTFSETDNSYNFDSSHMASLQDWYGKVRFNIPATAGGMISVPGFKDKEVIFDSYGRATNFDATHTEEAVYLKNKEYNDEDYRVKVSSNSGKVTVEHWNGVNAWVE